MSTVAGSKTKKKRGRPRGSKTKVKGRKRKTKSKKPTRNLSKPKKQLKNIRKNKRKYYRNKSRKKRYHSETESDESSSSSARSETESSSTDSNELSSDSYDSSSESGSYTSSSSESSDIPQRRRPYKRSKKKQRMQQRQRQSTEEDEDEDEEEDDDDDDEEEEEEDEEEEEEEESENDDINISALHSKPIENNINNTAKVDNQTNQKKKPKAVRAVLDRHNAFNQNFVYNELQKMRIGGNSLNQTSFAKYNNLQQMYLPKQQETNPMEQESKQQQYPALDSPPIPIEPVPDETFNTIPIPKVTDGIMAIPESDGTLKQKETVIARESVITFGLLPSWDETDKPNVKRESMHIEVETDDDMDEEYEDEQDYNNHNYHDIDIETEDILQRIEREKRHRIKEQIKERHHGYKDKDRMSSIGISRRLRNHINPKAFEYYTSMPRCWYQPKDVIIGINTGRLLMANQQRLNHAYNMTDELLTDTIINNNVIEYAQIYKNNKNIKEKQQQTEHRNDGSDILENVDHIFNDLIDKECQEDEGYWEALIDHLQTDNDVLYAIHDKMMAEAIADEREEILQTADNKHKPGLNEQFNDLIMNHREYADHKQRLHDKSWIDGKLNKSEIVNHLRRIQELKKGPNPNKRRMERRHKRIKYVSSYRDKIRIKMERKEEEEKQTSSEGDDVNINRKRYDLDPNYNTKYERSEDLNESFNITKLTYGLPNGPEIRKIAKEFKHKNKEFVFGKRTLMNLPFNDSVYPKVMIDLIKQHQNAQIYYQYLQQQQMNEDIDIDNVENNNDVNNDVNNENMDEEKECVNNNDDNTDNGSSSIMDID